MKKIIIAVQCMRLLTNMYKQQQKIYSEPMCTLLLSRLRYLCIETSTRNGGTVVARWTGDQQDWGWKHAFVVLDMFHKYFATSSLETLVPI